MLVKLIDNYLRVCGTISSHPNLSVKTQKICGVLMYVSDKKKWNLELTLGATIKDAN